MKESRELFREYERDFFRQTFDVIDTCVVPSGPTHNLEYVRVS